MPGLRLGNEVKWLGYLPVKEKRSWFGTSEPDKIGSTSRNTPRLTG
jgi:hypothetical protein